MDTKLIDEESLRLLRAFFSVRDPDARAMIVKLVEDAAVARTAPEVGEQSVVKSN